MRFANSPVAHVYPLIGLVLCLTLALLSSDVLGLNSCPPPAKLDPTGALGYKNYIHGGCISKTKNTVSFPGAPNLSGKFGCGDSDVSIPCCCLEQISKSKTLAKQNDRSKCITVTANFPQLNTAASKVNQKKS
ncbi:hypothetical protein PCANC_19600 [Puccinia coronata f. sp. avenae]|uniref:Hydrophobin n=1 Tax=Puccinia coronata f. sp. avenae TaxID=200324 RepID=A0A2N5SP67_9BASI|nr:hypothetical protein PCANC_19600 [Puccinia coronata f. sp. avenae]